jgi:hypothetical protein
MKYKSISLKVIEEVSIPAANCWIFYWNKNPENYRATN